MARQARRAGIPASSGTRPINFAQDVFDSVWRKRYYADSVISQISSTSIIDRHRDTLTLGSTIKMRKAGVGSLRTYRLNQELEHDNVQMSHTELTLGEAYYYSIKLDSLAYKMNREDLTTLLQEYQSDLKIKLALKTDKVVLDKMFRAAAACNRGHNAGVKYANTNLGSPANPLTLTKDNFFTLALNMKMVLDQQNLPMSDRFMLLPMQAEAIIMQHPSFTDLCCTKVLLGEALPKTIHGFNVIFTQSTPSYQGGANGADLVYPVIAGYKQATQYAMLLSETRNINQDARHWGRFWQGIFVQGSGVTEPDQIAVAVVKLEHVQM